MVLMNLSKEFDCLPHDHFIAKFEAFGSRIVYALFPTT